ncbi:MAG: hypothetical protein HOP29_15755 [Phycisphaerales bacterium]|nr:hypothetical protein [Phycisphaerales bacterium]
MLRCEDCEFFSRGPDGRPMLACDVYSTIKEPECVGKIQVNLLQRMVRAFEATLDLNRRLAPLQEKMMRHVEREIDEADDADKWKFGGANDDEAEDDRL